MAIVTAYIVVETIVLLAGMGTVLNSAFFSTPDTMTFVYVAVGAAAGLVLGGLLAWLFRSNVRAGTNVSRWPLWIATLVSAEMIGGLVFMLRANQPNDWRIIATAIELGTVPGLLLGAFISYKFTQWTPLVISQPAALPGGLTLPVQLPVEALALLQDDPAVMALRETLDRQLRQLESRYASSQGELLEIRQGEYTTVFSSPHPKGKVTVYIVCELGYPAQAPTSVNIELERAATAPAGIEYTGRLLATWLPHYALSDLVGEVFNQI